MANTVISLKKSGTPAAIPVDLANGELAINYADGKIFYKSAAGLIQEISGAGTNSFGTVNANGTLIVSDTSGDVFSLVPGNGITIVGDAINDTITISSVADVSLPYDAANAAYNQANSATTIGSAAFDKANNSETISIAAFEKANSGGSGGGANALFQRFVANGSQTAFLLSNNVSQQNNTIVSVDGLLQIPDLHYTISGSVLTFSTEPLNKSNIDVRVFSTTSTTIGTTGNNITVYLEDLYNHANIVGFAANTYSAGVGVAANSYASGVIGVAANSYASGVGANANSFASFVGLAANSYARAIGTSSNAYAASLISSATTIASAAFNKANSTTYTSNVVISVADNSNAALRITHTGNSAAFLVEDSANPDSTPFIIDANGSVGIGNTTPSSKLTVAGVIESTTGGVKFPDGTTQTTAPTVTTGKAIAMAIVFGG